MDLSPVLMVFFGAIFAAAGPTEKLRLVGLFGSWIGFFLTGLFMGSGRYRRGYLRARDYPPSDTGDGAAL